MTNYLVLITPQIYSTHLFLMHTISTPQKHYDIITGSFRGPHIWQNLPPDIKNSDLLNLSKSNIKKVWNHNVSLQVV